MLTWRLVLKSGLVFTLDGPWLEPDGKPAKDQDGKTLLPLKVGGIFPEWEETDAVEDTTEEGEEGEDSGPSVQTRPSGYLVFAKAEPGSELANSNEVRVRRVPWDSIEFAEESWDATMAARYILEEMSAIVPEAALEQPANQPAQQQPPAQAQAQATTASS